LKGEKDPKHHHISITPKSALAILPPKKVSFFPTDFLSPTRVRIASSFSHPTQPPKEKRGQKEFHNFNIPDKKDDTPLSPLCV
jgi:hypothetical protein